MVDGVEAARTLRDQLIESNAEHEARIEENNRLIESLNAFLGEGNQPTPGRQIQQISRVDGTHPGPESRGRAREARNASVPKAGKPHPLPSRAKLIAQVMHEIGKPTPIAHLREPLRRKGYGAGMEDRNMYNSIYTALTSKPEYFVVGEENRWSLTPEGESFAEHENGREERKSG